MIDKFDGEFDFLSNFFELSHPVIFNGIKFFTVENAFQAAKTLDKEIQLKFVDLTPGQAKRFGRKVLLRKDWEKVKEEIMFDLIFQKFSKSSTLKNLLIQTFPEELIEGNYWHDTFWGICEGVGENKLGNILMDIRDILIGS